MQFNQMIQIFDADGSTMWTTMSGNSCGLYAVCVTGMIFCCFAEEEEKQKQLAEDGGNDAQDQEYNLRT